MATILPSVVFGFIILFLASLLNALEDDPIFKYDNAPEDLSEVDFRSVSFNNHPLRRIIRPSSWSKEETGDLKSNDNKNIKNKEQDALFFEEEPSIWNIKKFLRYFASLLHSENENNYGSSDKSANNEKFKANEPININPVGKSEKKIFTKKPDSGNDQTLNKSETGENVQNSGTNVQNKSKNGRNVQKPINIDSLSKLEDGKERKFGTTDVSNKSYNEKIGDYVNAESLGKSFDNSKIENLSNTLSLNRRESTKNLKMKAQDSTDKSGKTTELEKRYHGNTDMENDMYEDETEDDYETGDDYESETEDDYVIDNNFNSENEINLSGIEYENEKENNHDYDRNKLAKNNQNLSVSDVTNKSALSKFVVQELENQKNHSSNQSSKNQFNNIDVPVNEITEPQDLTNQENKLQEFQLSSSEFIDNYINNPESKVLHRKKEESSISDNFNPNLNHAKNEVSLKLNKDSQNESSPLENIQNTFISDHMPVSSFKKDRKTEVKSLNLSPYEQMPHHTDILQPLQITQNDYNAFTESVIPDFKNNRPLLETFPDSARNTNEYKPEIINSYQITPAYAIPMQNEMYLSDQYSNDDFQNVNKDDMIKQNKQEFTDTQKEILQQSIFSNIQNRDIPITKNKIMYIRNYKPIPSVGSSNAEIPSPNENMSKNYMTLDDSESYSKYNQNFSPEVFKSGMTVSQNQIDGLKLQNRVNNKNNNELLNQKTESANQPDIFIRPQQLLSQNDIDKSLPQNKINNHNKMGSEIFSTQDNSKYVKFLISQKDFKDSDRQSPHSFKIAEDDLENNNSENKTSFRTFPENIDTKSSFLQTKTTSSKSLNTNNENNVSLDKSEKYEQETSDSNSINRSSSVSSNRDYDSKSDKEEDTEMIGLSNEKNSIETEIEDDSVNEKKCEDQNKDEEDEHDEWEEDEEEEEDDDEDEEEDEEKEEDEEDEEEEEGGEEDEDEVDEKEKKEENEDNNDYRNQNNYDLVDRNKDDKKNDQKLQAAIAGERTSGTNVTPPNITIQGISDKKSYSETQSPIPQITNTYNAKAEDDKSQNKIYEESPMQITQENLSRIEDHTTKQQKPQNELSSANQERKYDTILEYIYKFSNNPLFKGIKEEAKQT